MRTLMTAAAMILANRSGNTQGGVYSPDDLFERTILRLEKENGKWINVGRHITEVAKGRSPDGVGPDGKSPCVTLKRSNGDFIGWVGDVRNFTGNLLVECYYKFNDVSFNDQVIWSGGTVAFRMISNRLRLINNVGTVMVDAAPKPEVGRWYHLRIIVWNRMWYVYIDGELKGSYSQSAVHDLGHVVFGAYSENSTTTSMEGAIFDPLYVLGSEYVDSFVPEQRKDVMNATEAPYDLLSEYVTFQLGYRTDGTPYNVVDGLNLVRHGDAEVTMQGSRDGEPVLSVKNGGHFSTLEGALNSMFDINDDDFTYELWFCPDEIGAGQQALVTRRTGGGSTGGSGGIQLEMFDSVPKATWGPSAGLWSVSIQGNTNTHRLEVGRWVHLAFTRRGDMFTFYVNGDIVRRQRNSAATYKNTNPISIGASFDGTHPFNGKITGVRITQRVARYNNNIPVYRRRTQYALGRPAVKLDGDPYFNNNTFLFYPEHLLGTALGHTPSIPSTFSISETEKLFGKPVTISSNGSGAITWARMQTTLNRGDYTIEFWVKTSRKDTTNSIVNYFGEGVAGTDTNNVFISTINDKLVFSNNAKNIVTDVSFTDGLWHHIAAVKKDNTTLLFLDGVIVGTGVNTFVPYENNSVRLGGSSGVSGEIAFGPARITSGIARYTENFVPDENTIQYKGIAF